MSHFKRRTYEVFNESKRGDRLGYWISLFLVGLIFLNVFASILESDQQLSKRFDLLFLFFEAFSMAIFSIEYNLRLWSCTESGHYKRPILGRLRYALRPMMIVDFVVILPFYLQLLCPSLDLRVLFVLRLFRVFRILHFRPLLRSMQLFLAVFQKRKDDLTLAYMLVGILIVVSSQAMYITESAVNPQFSNIPKAMWWSLITITTIGYGDVVPITAWGKIVGSLTSLVGICAFGLPIAIFGAGFISELDERRQQRALKQKQAEEAEEAEKIALRQAAESEALKEATEALKEAADAESLQRSAEIQALKEATEVLKEAAGADGSTQRPRSRHRAKPKAVSQGKGRKLRKSRRSRRKRRGTLEG